VESNRQGDVHRHAVGGLLALTGQNVPSITPIEIPSCRGPEGGLVLEQIEFRPSTFGSCRAWGLKAAAFAPGSQAP